MLSITGASSQVGRELIKLLKEKMIKAKLLSREPEKISKQDGIFETVFFDYQDSMTFLPALTGCERLFLVCSGGINHQILESFLNEAKTQGIKQIVCISGFGIRTNKKHRFLAIEKIVENSFIPMVSLRANWFMQNFSSYFFSMIKKKRCLTFPDGGEKLSFVDARDIAEVALHFFTSPISEINQYFDITGEKSLSHKEVAEIFTKYLPCAVSYQELTEKEAQEQLGWDGVWLEFFKDIRKGNSAAISNSVQEILGKPARRFEDYIQESRGIWI